MVTEPRDPASVTVTVHHRCLSGAAGSTLGPYDEVTFWVIDRGRLHLVGGLLVHRQPIEDAVWARLGGSPGDRVRADQDAAADALD
jgi:hypothetical protein